MRRKAFQAALPYSLPICIGFLFMSISYGFLMRSKGFPAIYPIVMSACIFAGSMEFVTIELLLSTFNPLHAFILTLMVNARHLFYGISMLDKYQGTGWKKFYLIFGMCDETFAINSTVIPPKTADRGWFMFFVTLLNQFYWVAGAAIGAILGSFIHFNTEGIDFIMTALFVVMLVNQWQETKDHKPVLVGLGCTLICLLLIGAENFMLPAMAAIVIVLTIIRGKSDKESADI